jgi:RND family efflux transporter MFP subunit
MNPQIDLTRLGSRGPVRDHGHTEPPAISPPRRLVSRYLLPVALLGGFAVLAGYSVRGSLQTGIPVRMVLPVIVETGTTSPAVSSGAAEVLFEAPGWIEPAPYTVFISAQTPGTVARLQVLEGQEVTSGALIAELVDTDAQLKVQEAEAEVALRRAEVAAARANWDNPTDLVETVRTARAKLDTLTASRARMTHINTIARRQAEIDLSLSRTGAGGVFPAEKAELESRAAQLALEEMDAEIRAASATLAAAEERLALRIVDRNRLSVAEAELARAEAALARARYDLSLRRIVAPQDGVIMRLFTVVGAALMPDVEGGMRVAAMYDPRRLQVRADVPLASAPRVQPGLDAEIFIDGLPGRPFRGRLNRVVHEADVQKNTLPVKVDILDPDPVLKPEMIVRLRFMARPAAAADGAAETTRTTVSRIMVPEELVMGGGPEALVWVLGSDQRARQRRVTPGAHREGGLREITSGLSFTDRLIRSNTKPLTDGARVRVVEE